jgi:hypothetical protein
MLVLALMAVLFASIARITLWRGSQFRPSTYLNWTTRKLEKLSRRLSSLRERVGRLGRR